MKAALRCIFAVGLGVLVSAGTLDPGAAFAAPTPDPNASSSASTTPTPRRSVSYQRDKGEFSLAVTPTRLAFGQRDIGTTQQITLINRGHEPLPITVQKRDFTVATDGSLRYQDKAAYSASSWVSVSPNKVVVQPGTAEVVTAVVSAPKEYEPGDHQMALVFVVPTVKSDQNIKVNRGVGLPIYVTAPGDLVDSVSLSGMSAPSFARGGPVSITATVTNSGTVHHDFRKPSPLTVTGAGTAEPFPDFTVPRDSVRNIATTWDPPLLCVCHPTVTMTSADGGLQTQRVRVVIFPWHLAAMGFGAVLLLLLVVRTSRRRYRASVTRAATLLSTRSAGDA